MTMAHLSMLGSKLLSEPPDPTEYPSYAEMYMRLVPGNGPLLGQLSDSCTRMKTLMEGLSEEQARFRYAPGKWSVKDVLLHLIDDERIYSYRALRIARGDSTPLPGFDQDLFARIANADNRSTASLLIEYELVRNSTLALFANLDDVALLRMGVGDGKHYTVRALAYHIAGHEQHHRALLEERYRTATAFECASG